MDQPKSFLGRLDASGVPLLVARLVLALAFGYLAYQKIVDPIAFLKQVREYGVLPTSTPLYLNLTAIILPWLELLCAAALLLGVARRGAALIVGGLLVFFTVILSVRAASLYADPANGFATFCAVKFDCGCGVGEVFICPKLAENVGLLIAALIVLFSRSERFCLTMNLWKQLDRTSVPALVARVGVGGMFAYMAIMKLLDPIHFLKETREYHILPTSTPLYLNLTAITVPSLELLCAAALLTGIARRGAALLIAGMLVFFTPMVYVRALALFNAPDAGYAHFCDVVFDCGCGTGEVFICRKLTENGLLLLGALIALFASHDRYSLPGLRARQPLPLPHIHLEDDDAQSLAG